MGKNQYYLGYDIGTDSLGYAATDENYSLKKFHGEPVWGTVLFEEAELNNERRMHRTARRRLDRRKQRVQLVQDLFAKEISQADANFFKRMMESRLVRSDAESQHTLFDDVGFTDANYHLTYPTIHHLIAELMDSEEKHDVRLVYLACAWLVAHRGHFLSEISSDNIAGLTDFSKVWTGLEEYIIQSNDEIVLPWETAKGLQAGNAIKGKAGVTVKYKRLCGVLFSNGKAPKKSDGFPYNCELLLKAICGGKINAEELFVNEEYKDLASFTLGDGDEKIEEIMGSLGDDAELIIRLKAIYDWALLVDILGECQTISEAKVKVYDQHKADLKTLKYMIKQYLPEKYEVIFKDAGKLSYASYSGHCTARQKLELSRCQKIEFSDNLKKMLKNVKPREKDVTIYNDMLARLELYTFLPKQHDTDNRVVPYQLYEYELSVLLQKASAYLPFLQEKDEDGLTVSDKILSVFTYRIPYYVGPLNTHSKHAWIVRKSEGRIVPWNFDAMVDRDLSEKKFIRRMTNMCTYLPDQPVLPKESLLYHRFTVLNEINNLKINGESISVEIKQAIYQELYVKKRKVTLAAIRGYLQSNGYMKQGDTLSGIDTAVHSDLKSYHDFKRLLSSGMLSEAQVERIIEQITYTEDKPRLKKWLKSEFSFLSQQDIQYIARLNYKDFGRLSRAFLTEFEGVDRQTGEIFTIDQAMWQTNHNLMELLSDKYTFAERLDDYQKEYYAEKKMTLDERLAEMRLSNAVRRPVLRTIEVTKEVVKAMKMPPAKIFIEMTRGATEDQKNKRTKSRKQQLEELYAKCKDEDVREMQAQLEAMGDAAETLLQSERLFLYYAQLGRCMYSGKTIDLNLLSGETYNIDHIYPRAYVKDDSAINNKVLVLSELNGQKLDTYPISGEIRREMAEFWDRLRRIGLISDEKYKRLIRNTPFSAEEQMGFINRQLTETSQSAKAVATVLREMYPETEIVYVKARLASEFRQTFELFKSRTFNDLHHAKDAYLNIVVGNVYSMRFSRQWFKLSDGYNVKPETLYTHPVVCNGVTVWEGTPALEKVKRTVGKNTAHLTKYAFCRNSGRNGGLFDQNPVKARKGLVQIKKGLLTEKYGGYNKATITFFSLVQYCTSGKKDVMIMPVERMFANRFLTDYGFAVDYACSMVSQIIGKQVESISFLLGKRILKINTVLSLDGFRVCLAGSSDNKTRIKVAPLMVFASERGWETYIKRLESLVEKFSKNGYYVFSEKYDKVTRERNIELYDLYIDKLVNSIFSKRINNPVQTLVDGRDGFIKLSVIEQAKTLLNIHKVFGHLDGGTDLTAIGGCQGAAEPKIGVKVSIWKKTYTDVRIIDTSISGLWEKQSDNLLELL